MRRLTKPISLVVLGFSAILAGIDVLPSDAQPPPIDQAQQRFSLFLAGTAKPAAVSTQMVERLDASLGGAEVLYSRWVQLGDFDPMTAKPGDRISIEVIPGESFELVVSRLDVDRHSGTRLVFASFTDLGYPLPYYNLFLSFEPNGNLSGGKLDIPWQVRTILFKSDVELPGWARVTEIKPGSGPELGNDLDIVDESKTKDAKEPESAKHSGQR